MLGGFVVVYMAFYVRNSTTFLLKCKRAEQGGRIKEYDGIVVEKTEEKLKAISGEMVDICYPRYKATVDGKELFHQSSVRRRGVEIDQVVAMVYDEGTGTIWVKDDVPLVRKQLIRRILLICTLLAMMALVSLFL